MAFDVFGLRDRVVGEYRDYVESFVHVRDPRVNDYVRTMLDSGELWPDAVLQLNPAYESAETLGELADKGVIAADTARFFGRDIRLHRHQREAIDAARANDHYVVSTGTGSGKSLAYLVPIVDHVLKNRPEDHTVRAIIVYPMNALINSQLAALEAFAKNWPGCPVTFGRYTGQDRGKDRDRILTDPPHILLTNYVMLEYMLIRPTDRALIHQATRALKFLAVDELHVYRGRQGADVAMLMRRVRQRAGRDDLLCIGTSATLVTGENRADSRARDRSRSAAGSSASPSSRNASSTRRCGGSPRSRHRPRARRCERQSTAPPPAATVDAVARHPLAAWVETTFGLDVDGDGILVRRKPIAFEDGLKRLVEPSGCRMKRAGRRSKPFSMPATPPSSGRANRCSPFGCTSFSPRAAASTRPSKRRIAARSRPRDSSTRPRRTEKRSSGSCIRWRSAANAARSTTSLSRHRG